MMVYIFRSKFPLPGRGLLGPPTGARPGGRVRQRASGGRTFAHGKRWRGTPRPWAHHLQVGPKGSGAKSFGWQPKAGTSVVRSWAAGKEPELVREVVKFRLDIDGLNSTHGKGSRTSLLERGWTGDSLVPLVNFNVHVDSIKVHVHLAPHLL